QPRTDNEVGTDIGDAEMAGRRAAVGVVVKAEDLTFDPHVEARRTGAEPRGPRLARAELVLSCRITRDLAEARGERDVQKTALVRAAAQRSERREEPGSRVRL